jgi:ABC-type uncharacterized transport system permease subunit
MNLLADLLFLSTALIYGVASILFLRFLAKGEGTAERIAPRLVALGATFHAVHIVVSSYVLHVCPVEGIHFPMSVVSMLMCVAYLVVRARLRIDVVGAFVAPLALTCLLASRFVGSGPVADQAPLFRDRLLPIHVTMNLLGIALFTLAFAAAALYLVQERLLKEKRVEGLFQRLPPLDSLDRAEHRFLLAGFPLLTIGILIGTLWAKQIEHGGAAVILRAALGYVMWLLIAAVLFLRAAAGWRGRRAAYGTIAGFGVALLVLILYLLRGKEQQVPVAARTLAAPTEVHLVLRAPGATL